MTAPIVNGIYEKPWHSHRILVESYYDC